MFKSKILILLILCGGIVDSQNEFKKWYFGRYAGLDFNTGNTPSVITHTTLYTFEGSSSIADQNGGLLFYTDGSTVWNKQQLVMANGTGLLGNGSTVQSALIVKQPGNLNLYYVFTLDLQGGPNGLRYSIVDMSLAAGMGSVTIKNVLLTTPCTEQLAATRHCNGIDMWVMTHDFTTNQFKAYLLTSAGVNTTAVVSAIGPVAPTFSPNMTAYGQGTIKFSHDSKKLGLTFFNGNLNSEIALFNFNSTTGIVTNYNSLLVGVDSYGCEFSPGSNIFYATQKTPPALLQWNLCAGTDTQIINSLNSFSLPLSAFGQMQLAPNGKIYLVTSTQSLSEIQNPDLMGSSCNLTINAQSVATSSNGFGLPNLASGVNKNLPTFTYTSNLMGCGSASFTSPPLNTIGSYCSASGYTVQSVLWIFGNGSITAANTSTLLAPTYTFGAPGLWPVKLVYKYQCGADTVMQNVLIVGPSIGANKYLCGSPAQGTVVIGNSPGPFSYTWMPGSQSGPVATINPGTYTVYVHDNSTNCLYYKSFTFIASAAVTVSSSIQPTQTCSGSTINLQAFVAGGTGTYSYNWTPGSSASSYTTTVTTVGTNTFHLLVTDANGCKGAATATVNVMALPHLGAQSATLCPKSTASLTVNGAINYSWMPGAGTGSVLVVSTAIASQQYTITGANAFGCINSATVMLIVSKCIGLEDFHQSTINIYPNPFSKQLHLHLMFPGEMILTDVFGRIVLRENLAEGDHLLETSSLESGLYFLSVGGGFQRMRLIKQD